MKKKNKRARDEEGQFVGDDPSTPDINEAFAEDALPAKASPKASPKASGPKKLTPGQIKKLKGEWGSKFKTKFKGRY
jgi:hypothetical protein